MKGNVLNLTRKLVVCGAVVASATAIGAATASAEQPYDPNVARIANPANACKSIPGSIEHAAGVFGAPVPDLSWFDYADCVRTLATGSAAVEPAEEFGSPYDQCDFLVSVGAITYPATLHSGEGDPFEDFLLPDLTVRDRKECGSALYAYHTIAPPSRAESDAPTGGTSGLLSSTATPPPGG